MPRRFATGRGAALIVRSQFAKFQKEGSKLRLRLCAGVHSGRGIARCAAPVCALTIALVALSSGTKAVRDFQTEPVGGNLAIEVPATPDLAHPRVEPSNRGGRTVEDVEAVNGAGGYAPSFGARPVDLTTDASPNEGTHTRQSAAEARSADQSVHASPPPVQPPAAVAGSRADGEPVKNGSPVPEATKSTSAVAPVVPAPHPSAVSSTAPSSSAPNANSSELNAVLGKPKESRQAATTVKIVTAVDRNPAHWEFIESAIAPAQASQLATGVPASATIGQAIHESNWGTSRLSREGKNYFGIKASGKAGTKGTIVISTWEHIGGADVTVKDAFRAYNSIADSFVDHGRFFLENSRYAKAMKKVDDPKAFVQLIAHAGYATDPNYARKVIAYMDRYDLYQFDLKP